MVAKTESKSLFKSSEDFDVKEVKSLNFFAIMGKNTKGSSNKSYHAELQSSKDGKKVQIYTIYGPTGGNQSEDWRHYPDEASASKDFASLIKSKLKKGYVEVDVAKRSLGSEKAKEIVKPVVFINDNAAPKNTNASKLDPKVQYLVKKIFGKTQDFVVTLLKCPLGQLSNEQIDKGRKELEEAKEILKRPKIDKKLIEQHTNNFYSLIPHNLGSGYRGQLVDLLLDDEKKIAQKEEDLDTLLDAKSVGLLLNSDNSVDKQYEDLKVNFEHIDENDPLFKWINNFVQKTRAANHSYYKNIVIHNAWKYNRLSERGRFTDCAKEIAKDCGKQVIPPKLNGIVDKRLDVYDEELFKKANVLSLFHGTRTENLLGITKKGLLIRPSNVVLCGSMYGGAIYSGYSTKAISYTSINNSYWAGGKDNKAYLFISDMCLGKQKIANGSYQYTKNNISPCHSVHAVGGKSGVINDEFMIYDVAQANLRYLLEFSCDS